MKKNTQQPANNTQVVTPLNTKIASTLTFLGAFANGAIRSQSTTMKLMTLVVESIETAVIVATKKTTQITKLDQTQSGQAFGKGFNEGQDFINTITKVSNELGQFDATSVQAFMPKAK